MLQLADHWVWDFWTAHDGGRHHVYYLVAHRSLGSQDRRHRHARIAHSSSDDLRSWTQHGTVLAPRGTGFDATATWTGSVVAGPDGRWRMFYTGSRFLGPEPEFPNVETVGVAVSEDLFSWSAAPEPVTEADGRWYEELGTTSWREEAWRDPWVFPAADGTGWHMLVTARAARGEGFTDDDSGVIGHAWSRDLDTWEVRAPLSAPGAGFGHLEVPQLTTVEGRTFLLFSCDTTTLSAERRLAGCTGGVWSVPVADHTLSGAVPFDTAAATLLLDERHYSARVVHDAAGVAHLLAVVNRSADGQFVGAISDPLPLHVDDDGRLSAVVA